VFTGLVEAQGRIRTVEPAGGGVRVVIDAGALDLADVAVGDSIAVDGCCLTVAALARPAFTVDVSRETLDCTTGFDAGRAVNLEKALRLSDRLGGHLMSGHVDGVGEVSGFERAGENWLLEVQAPASLAKYLARKGSIAVNGVSLTVNRVEDPRFTANLIPHTAAVTNLGALRPGDRVNLEVDLVARYLERLVRCSSS
jgi:riboflavin synthase